MFSKDDIFDPCAGFSSAVMFSLHKQNSFFSNLSRKYCCDANIIATKCVHFDQ